MYFPYERFTKSILSLDRLCAEFLLLFDGLLQVHDLDRALARRLVPHQLVQRSASLVEGGSRGFLTRLLYFLPKVAL